MRWSPVRCRVDPEMIVQKRLPQHARKKMLRQQLWERQDEENEEGQARQDSTPAIVVQIAQAAKQRKRQPQLWANLLDQALASQGELSPQHMAGVLQSMSEARFRHNALLDEFIRSLSYRADVKAMVTAMLAVERLGLPTEALRTSFLQQLSGQCESLSFGDLRRILMALARCWQSALVHNDILDELCGAIVLKSEDCDPRDLVAVPQHLGRLQFPHADLLHLSVNAVASLITSRLAILALDVFRAMDGLILLLPVVSPGQTREQLASLAVKCRLLAARLLRQSFEDELWRIGRQLLGVQISEASLWEVWASEVVARRKGDDSRARSVAQARRKISKQWGLRRLPEGLELALQSVVKMPMGASVE